MISRGFATGLAVSLLVIAGASVAVYRSRSPAGYLDPEHPDRPCEACGGRWAESDLPVEVELGQEVEAWRSAFVAGAAAWNAAAARPLLRVRPRHTPCPSGVAVPGFCEPAPVEVSGFQGSDPTTIDGSAGRPHPHATPRFRGAEHRIVEAHVAVPFDDDFEGSRAKIARHELGHVLGLADSPWEFTAMYRAERFVGDVSAAETALVRARYAATSTAAGRPR